MYRDIIVEQKVEAIIEVLRGTTLSKVAMEYKVDRNSLHLWVKRAKKGIEASLVLRKRGPKLSEKSFRAKEEKIKQLRKRFGRLKEEMRELKGDIELAKHNGKEEIRPEKCSSCGCEKVYKNGKSQVSGAKLISIIKKGTSNRYAIQQFVCGYCNRRVGFRLNSAIEYSK